MSNLKNFGIMKEYKGFEIARKKGVGYYIIAMGSVIGTAKTVQAAKEWIDELCYLED